MSDEDYIAKTSRRFRKKLASRPNKRGCVIWCGCIGSDGYGHFRYRGKVVAAHRVAFFLHHGHWPRGHARHSCDTPLCCEPAHLEDGTHKQNMEECAARRRNRSPRPGNGHRKLSVRNLRAIRHAYSRGQRNKSALARKYGVTPSRIRQIVNGQRSAI